MGFHLQSRDFRVIDIDKAVLFGFTALHARLPLWLLLGGGMAAIHAGLLHFITQDGTPVTLLERVVVALLAGVWPMRIACDNMPFQASPPRLGSPRVRLSGVFSLALVFVALFGLSLLGGYGFNRMFNELLGGWIKPFFSHWKAVVSPQAAIAVYPLTSMGAVVMALIFSFAPLAVALEGHGPFGALGRSRQLAYQVLFEMVFLHGAMFVLVGLAFFLIANLPAQGRLSFFLESEILCLAMVYAMGVWTNAYRQVIEYEKPVERRPFYMPSQRRVHRIR
ncbi:MAG: hypothetical protein IPN23_04970 [Elusimicrobia bacterium]|nr:hypothetical protein [Elusimicrobiota bacterium]